MHTIAKLRLLHLPLSAALMLNAGCEADLTIPTRSDQQAVEVYADWLEPLGANTYVFSLNVATTVQVMLAGAVVENPLRSVAPVLRVTLSVWDAAANACTPIGQVETRPRLTAVLQLMVEPATYCVTVTDPGNLAERTSVSVRVVAPAMIYTGAPAGTHVFENTITPGGRATRTFEVGSIGDAQITLVSLTGPQVEVGLGVGVFYDGLCYVGHTVPATPGPAAQLTMRVDPGTYCAMIFDPAGAITGQQTFSTTIAHP